MEAKDNVVRERIRSGDWEIEVEGSPEYVKNRIMDLVKLASKVQDSNEEISPQELAIVLPDANVKTNGHVMHVSEQETVYDAEIMSYTLKDILDFYLSKDPQNQGDQVLLITYFYQKYLGYETVSLDDYGKAYTYLKKAAVEEPSNMKSSVRNVVDRTKPKLLFNPGRGMFQLTLQGERHVENLGKKE